MSELKREQFRRAVAILSVTAVIGVLVLLIVYSKVAFDIGVVCPIHEILGLECPGCGGTRMALAIMELDFYQAFRYNPFLFVTLPIWAVGCWHSSGDDSVSGLSGVGEHHCIDCKTLLFIG